MLQVGWTCVECPYGKSVGTDVMVAGGQVQPGPLFVEGSQMSIRQSDVWPVTQELATTRPHHIPSPLL